MEKEKKRVLPRLLLACGLLMSPFLAHGSTEPKFVVCTNSGGVYEFLIADNPVITYKDNLLVVGNEKGLSVSVNAEEVVSFDFVPSASEPTAVDAVSLSGRFHSLFSGMQDGSRIEVLTLEGKILESVTVGADGKAAMDFTRLPKGIYVVKTEKGSFKIRN